MHKLNTVTTYSAVSGCCTTNNNTDPTTINIPKRKYACRALRFIGNFHKKHERGSDFTTLVPIAKSLRFCV